MKESISAVYNKEYAGAKKPQKQKKSSWQQAAGSIMHTPYTKTNKIVLTGDIVILVGKTTIESKKIKAVPVPFVTESEHDLYYWHEEKGSSTHVSMPDKAQSMTSFYGPVRVYTDKGLILTVQAEPTDKVMISRTENLIVVRTGQTTSEIVREKKTQQLAQMGVWRA